MTRTDGSREHSRLLFESPLVKIGRFDVAVDDPEFETAGAIEDRPHLVFPARPVIIEQAGRDPFVADPNIVVLYNQRQEYRRRRLGDEGDHCHWVSIRSDLLLDTLKSYDERVADYPDAPFRRSHVPSESQTWLFHHLILRYLKDETDPIGIEELLLRILDAVAGEIPDTKAVRRASTRPLHDVAEQVKTILALNLSTRISLDKISDAVGVSPSHVCRQFRATTGWTVHRYHRDLRLRRALERLPEFRGELTDLALELGFSSHSHFTSSFRQRFGVTPQELQPRLSTRRLQGLLAAAQTPSPHFSPGLYCGDG